jgi:hypothetical protein
MLLALLKRVDTFLHGQEAQTVKEVILFWKWPRCRLHDRAYGSTADLTTSPDIAQKYRIQDVYLYKDSRQCYIRYCDEEYSVSPPLPNEVDVHSIWDITKDRGFLIPGPIVIWNKRFYVKRYYGPWPWIMKSDENKKESLRPGFEVEEIQNAYDSY